jgi:hypothetical protein
MTKRKKRAAPACKCLFCSDNPEEVGSVLFSAAPVPSSEGICEACVVRFYAKLYELKFLDMMSTKNMTRH